MRDPKDLKADAFRPLRLPNVAAGHILKMPVRFTDGDVPFKDWLDLHVAIISAKGGAGGEYRELRDALKAVAEGRHGDPDVQAGIVKAPSLLGKWIAGNEAALQKSQKPSLYVSDDTSSETVASLERTRREMSEQMRKTRLENAAALGPQLEAVRDELEALRRSMPSAKGRRR